MTEASNLSLHTRALYQQPPQILTALIFQLPFSGMTDQSVKTVTTE
jgi:hypothetical protein